MSCLFYLPIFILMLVDTRHHCYTAHSLYDPLTDHIDILNASSFNSYVYDNAHGRFTFVENYAHWCGACQRFAAHWKELAKETRHWHANVVRIAAINCGDSFNDNTCQEHNIRQYPTLKLFTPHSHRDDKEKGGEKIGNDKSQALIGCSLCRQQ